MLTIGQKYKLKPYSKDLKTDPYGIIRKMNQYFETIVTIAGNHGGYLDWFRINEDGLDCVWHESWFEPGPVKPFTMLKNHKKQEVCDERQ